MNKINFTNLPSTTTPVNATNLNLLQDNVDSGKQDKMTEGEWTPTLDTIEGVEPTVTYSSRRGRYKRIGNMAFLSFYIRGKITALNGTNNFAQIKGLPFQLKQITLGENVIPVGVMYQLLANTENVVICPYGGRLRVQYNYGTGADALKVTPTNYFEFGGSGWCEIE